MHHLGAFRQRQQRIGHAEAEILVEVRFKARIGETVTDGADEEFHRVGRYHAESVHQDQCIHVPFGGHRVDEIEHPVDFRAGEIDREKDHLQAPLMGVGRGFDGQINGFLKWPLVAVFDQMRAGRDFHDQALDATVHGGVDVGLHAAAEGIDVRAQIALDDGLDGAEIVLGDGRKTRLDAVDTGFGQGLRNADLVVVGVGDGGLLLAVTQRNVVDLDGSGEVEIPGHLVVVVPGAAEPVIGLPRLFAHFDCPRVWPAQTGIIPLRFSTRASEPAIKQSFRLLEPMLRSRAFDEIPHPGRHGFGPPARDPAAS